MHGDSKQPSTVYALWYVYWDTQEVVAVYEQRPDAETHLERYAAKHPGLSKRRGLEIREHALYHEAPTFMDLTEKGERR